MKNIWKSQAIKIKSLIAFLLDNCFFQTFAVSFMQRAADIVALNVLSRTYESHEENVLSLHFLKSSEAATRGFYRNRCSFFKNTSGGYFYNLMKGLFVRAWRSEEINSKMKIENIKSQLYLCI